MSKVTRPHFHVMSGCGLGTRLLIGMQLANVILDQQPVFVVVSKRFMLTGCKSQTVGVYTKAHIVVKKVHRPLRHVNPTVEIILNDSCDSETM